MATGNCIICQEELRDDTFALKCGHLFHKACVDDWCNAKHCGLEDLVCPVCNGSQADMSINEQRMLFQGGDALPQSTLLDGGVVAVEDDDETGPPQASGSAPALAALTTAAEADVAAAAVTAAAPQASGSVVEECVRHDVANDQSTAEWGEGSDIAQMSDIASLAGEDFASLAGDLELGGAIVSGEQPAFEPTMPLTAGCAMERFSIDTVAAWHGQHHIVCCDCMQPCKASFRLISKGELKFRCGKCGYSHLRLYREDREYRATLANFPKAELVDFFKGSHELNAKEQRQKFLKMHSEYSARERKFDFGGSFKPVSVLERMGYDVVAIATKSLPEDVRPCRLFGMIYRVPQLWVGKVGREGTRTQSDAHREWKKRSLLNKLQAPEADAAAPPAAPW